MIEELCASGYVERRLGVCRPALPSLASHLGEMQRDAPSRGRAVQAIRAAVSDRIDREEAPGAGA